MSRISLILTLSLTAIAFSLGTLPAQTSGSGGAGDAPAVAAAQEATSDQLGSGLPQRAQQPRTMRAYWHVFIAFAATWLLLFGYALSLGRRFGRLEEEIRQVQGG